MPDSNLQCATVNKTPFSTNHCEFQLVTYTTAANTLYLFKQFSDYFTYDLTHLPLCWAFNPSKLWIIYHQVTCLSPSHESLVTLIVDVHIKWLNRIMKKRLFGRKIFQRMKNKHKCNCQTSQWPLYGHHNPDHLDCFLRNKKGQTRKPYSIKNKVKSRRKHSAERKITLTWENIQQRKKITLQWH